MAARCDSEAANVLGLNMVHELVTGKWTVQEARHTSGQSTVADNAGREAPYAERLLFQVPEGSTEDLDQSHPSGALPQQAVGKRKDTVTRGRGGSQRPSHPQLTLACRSRLLDGQAGGRPASSEARQAHQPPCPGLGYRLRGGPPAGDGGAYVNFLSDEDPARIRAADPGST